MELLNNARGLSGNALKLIACATMLCDHIGVLLFPRVALLRVIGRLAFPIFAFMIAEGSRYTRNRLRHFLTISIFATVIQLVYYFALHDTDMSILVTFSLSIPLIYAFDYAKRCVLSANRSLLLAVFSSVLFFAGVIAAWSVCRYVKVDYGFYGVMTPVITSAFMLPKDAPEELRRFDTTPVHIACCGLALLLLCGMGQGSQSYSLISLALLLLYSGKRGKAPLKYFFYIFYPTHLVVLWLISKII